ncbi:GatB/YqeY domain-containing protein [Auriculariales sp. MPI-PUGE-AT-0066]|nr:GatB/YqeY domain-containing protein [Auriculariales sp. MPI-PUGE-AT-0066]
MLAAHSLFRRCMSSAVAGDFRLSMQKELLAARKAKDLFRTNALRSVLADMTNAEKKTSEGTLPTPAAISLLRKSIALRREAATQYSAGNRADLADNESAEADLLSTFLPPQKSEAEIEEVLRKLFAQHTANITGDGAAAWDKARVGRTTGAVLRAFREQVDPSTVDMDFVAERLKSLIEAAAASA